VVPRDEGGNGGGGATGDVWVGDGGVVVERRRGRVGSGCGCSGYGREWESVEEGEGGVKLDNQFEWDLENENALPEEFAEGYTQDLGLNGEFRWVICFRRYTGQRLTVGLGLLLHNSIREQVQTYQKSLFLVGHPSDGTAVLNDDLRLSFLPSLTSAARPVDQVQLFTSLLNYLSDGKIEKNKKDREQDMTKQRKRNTHG
jgi:SWI/SNF-related matrix-associated actin-dependent regulator of chromatin subfamily B protein 1